MRSTDNGKFFLIIHGIHRRIVCMRIDRFFEIGNYLRELHLLLWDQDQYFTS